AAGQCCIAPHSPRFAPPRRHATTPRRALASAFCTASSTSRAGPRILAAMTSLRTARGHSLPLGATAQANGVNFAVFCRHGTRVWLILYPLDAPGPLAEFELHPLKTRTGNHWHVVVAGLPETFRY